MIVANDIFITYIYATMDSAFHANAHIRIVFLQLFICFSFILKPLGLQNHFQHIYDTPTFLRVARCIH